MTAFPAAGTVLQVGTGVGATPPAVGTDTFTTVAEVNSITGPGLTKAQIDVTALNDLAKKFVGDLPEPGTLDFTLFFDAGDTQHQTIFADVSQTQRKRNWRIIIDDDNATQTTDSQFDFVGEVVSWSNSFEQGGAITAEVSIQISGAVTLTPRS